MAWRDAFERCNGPRIDGVPLSNAGRDLAVGNVPASLTDFWLEVGVAAYVDRAFWFCDPAYYATYVERDRHIRGGYVVARNSFADLFVWKAGTLLLYTPTQGMLTTCGPHLDIWFEHALCAKTARTTYFRLRQHRSMQERHGAIASDECYGWVPIEAMGGSGELDTVQRLKLLPYLESARQALQG